MQFIVAHQVMILSVLLTLSETLAMVLPSSGGILKSIINVLKLLGAKDQDGQ